MRARHGGRAVVVAVLALVATACVGSVDRSDFEADLRARGGGLSQLYVDEALSALAEAVGTDRLVLQSLTLTPLHQEAQAVVRDPDQPDNLDSYQVRQARVASPAPVQVSDSLLLEATTFAVADVAALDDVEALADEAVAALDVADGVVETVRVAKGSEAVVVTVDVDGPRASGTATFDAAGTLIEAVRR